LPGGPEKNHEKSGSKLSVPWPRFERVTSQRKVSSVNMSVSFFGDLKKSNNELMSVLFQNLPGETEGKGKVKLFL
jgi:hypothetical protein